MIKQIPLFIHDPSDPHADPLQGPDPEVGNLWTKLDEALLTRERGVM